MPTLLEPYVECWPSRRTIRSRLVMATGREPPIRIEIYRSHEDFSVRTVGLSGLGALGVSFGRVVAMDSPAARRVGEFNWGSTLWHELGHVFTLGATERPRAALAVGGPVGVRGAACPAVVGRRPVAAVLRRRMRRASCRR